MSAQSLCRSLAGGTFVASDGRTLADAMEQTLQFVRMPKPVDNTLTHTHTPQAQLRNSSILGSLVI